jgi:hypothetical protein
MASPPLLNLTAVPVVTYEYLFYLSSSEELRPHARRKAQRLLLGSYTPDTTSRWLRLKKTGHDLMPSSGK